MYSPVWTEIDLKAADQEGLPPPLADAEPGVPSLQPPLGFLRQQIGDFLKQLLASLPASMRTI
jgi:hypothetical protein